MSVTTRRATPHDASAVARAHVRAWQAAYEGIVPQAYLDAINLEQRTMEWTQYLGEDTPTDYVAELDGHVIGFANVGPFRGMPEDHSCGELWAMYVHPDHWGTGAGYALMQCTMRHFEVNDVTTGYLWVLEDNAQARRFYERQGWQADDEAIEDDIGGTPIVERRYSLHMLRHL